MNLYVGDQLLASSTNPAFDHDGVWVDVSKRGFITIGINLIRDGNSYLFSTSARELHSVGGAEFEAVALARQLFSDNLPIYSDHHGIVRKVRRDNILNVQCIDRKLNKLAHRAARKGHNYVKREDLDSSAVRFVEEDKKREPNCLPESFVKRQDISPLRMSAYALIHERYKNVKFPAY